MEYIYGNFLFALVFYFWYFELIPSASPSTGNTSLQHQTSFGTREDTKVLTLPNHISRMSNQRRLKRGYVYKDHEIRALVDIHNTYRRNVTPPASDMNYVTWNTELASLAERWARQCQWKHGHPKMPNSSRPEPLPYDGSVAQNIWRSSSKDPRLTQAVTEWFDEMQFYDFHSSTCEVNRICGHYRIIAFGQLQELGCGSALCLFGFYTVCNYAPSVPETGAPYKPGPACAQCESGEGWCNEGLCSTCDSDIEETYNSTCECNLTCQNCGVFDNDTCSCQCKPGWTSTDCSELCEDSRDNCNPLCADFNKARDCPASCNICERIDQTMNESELCCDGRLCPPGEVLNDTCHCIVYAPFTSAGVQDRSTRCLHWFILTILTMCLVQQ
ncbi:cysteine-rich venom protein-like [Amphiura filiformis]|uniref:cysteine-rich venom protein-like n=1 Tax=Amphiura filiformis TaxID=82378 RepID=UPI003B217DE2